MMDIFLHVSWYLIHHPLNSFRTSRDVEGAQWLSGRVLDWRSKGCRFGPHQRHWVVSLEQDALSLLSTGSTLEDPS